MKRKEECILKNNSEQERYHMPYILPFILEARLCAFINYY